jgi:hypothetical protein
MFPLHHSFSVNNYSDKYNYKSYLRNMLDFDHNIKMAPLAMQGWQEDIVGQYDNEENSGFQKRRDYFLKSRPASGSAKTTSDFKSEGVTFFGNLETDFQNCHQGLIPFTPWQVDITFKVDPSKFVLWIPANEIKKYLIEVEFARLHIQMGSLNERVFKSLQTSLESESAKYHYRGTNQKFSCNENI